MEKKYINPDSLMAPRGYTHVVTVEGARKLVFISGQVAFDKQGNLVGKGDLPAQVRQAAHNLADALAAAGATPEDIVKMNTYVVNYQPADLAALREARGTIFRGGEPPASTLVGVTGLAVEGLLVEIEAIAAVK